MCSTNISLCGLSVNVLSTINDNLRCLLCSEVLDNPHQSSCGCRFCLSCFKEFLHNNNKTCPGKTEDCLELSLDLLRPDILARREINKIIVKCCLSSCDKECSLLEMKDHLEKCSLSIIRCSECNENVTRGELENHGATSCIESLVRCEFCDETMKRRNLEEEHQNFCHDNICVSYTNYCPNECEESDKVLWVEHRRICSKKCSSCPYKVIGCTASDVIVSDMPRHLSDNEFCHAELLVKETENISNEIATLDRAVGAVKEEMSFVKEYVKERTNMLQCQIRDISITKCSTEEMRRSDLNIMNHMTTKITELTKETKDAQALSISRLICEMEKMKKEMETVKNNQEENLLLKGEILKLRISNETLESKVRNRKFAFIWTVENFSKINDLVSPPFYTNPIGYKMNMTLLKRVKGHISLYATLLCGEYDNELSWPFRKKIIMGILDQEKLGRDIEKCLLVDEKRKYYPSKDFIGFNEFISYKDLSQNSYLLKKNRLRIYCLVEG